MFGLLTALFFVSRESFVPQRVAFSKYLSWLLKHTEISSKAGVKELGGGGGNCMYY